NRNITVSGDGSLLRVSNGAMVGLTRSGARAGTGSILIGTMPGTTTLATANPTGATIAGGAALTVDSSGGNALGPKVQLTANAYDLSGNVINIGGGASGLVLNSNIIADFAGATSVLLKSA